jgi:squalene-hopene/tetraprenyl-beta-curcumene cyclase
VRKTRILALVAAVALAVPPAIAADGMDPALREKSRRAVDPGTDVKQGLLYYYNALAKVMPAYGESRFEDGKGQRHDWRSALAQKLVSLQAAEGSWVNEDSNEWLEDKPQLVTAWCVIAVEHTLK